MIICLSEVTSMGISTGFSRPSASSRTCLPSRSFW